MAQRKRVIDRVEECECDNCIYAFDAGATIYCYLLEGDADEDLGRDWCEHGLWVVEDAEGDVFCASLAAIYAIEAEKAKGRCDDDEEEDDIDLDGMYRQLQENWADVEDRLTEIESRLESIPLPRRKTIDTQK